MKRHWKLMVLTSLVIVLPILAGIFLWNQLPEQIPSHWNLAGAVDGWSSKPWAVFAMPLLLLALHWFAVFVTFADPKMKNHSEKILHLVFWLIPLLNAVLSAITYSTALGAAVQVELVVAVFMGLLFVIMQRE